MQIKHQFTSPKADGTDATQVQPSNWNADHTLSVTGPVLVGKATAGAGAAAEIPLGSGLAFSGGALVVTVSPGGNGSGASLGSATPQPLGTATPGVAALASREDHAHAMPTPAEIGAASSAQGVKADSAVQPSDMATALAAKADAAATATALTGKAAVSHTHAITDVSGLQTALDAKATHAEVTSAIAAVVNAAPAALDTLSEIAVQLANDESAAAALTAAVAGKAAIAHGHAIGDVTGLQGALDGKSATGHGHTTVDVAGLDAALAGKAAAAHSHTIGNVTGLQASLDAKADAGHTHAIANVTGLQTALDDKATHAEVTAAITAVVNAAPAALDTLGEIAAQLANDESAAAALTSAVAGKAAAVHAHAISDVSGLQAALNAKAGTAEATLTTAGLLSAADKFKVNNMPSPQFLWDAVHARTPIIAHAGDSISYMTGQANGDNYLLQCLSREYPARIEYGEHKTQVYTGTLSCTVNGDTTATLFYDGANSDAAFMESNFAVNKWLFFPTSGVGHGWDGQEMQIIGFDTTAKTITVKSDIQYLPATGPLLSFPSTSNVTLKITETADRYVLAKGGHTSTQIKDGQIRAIQAWTTPPDIMILNGGTNDGTYLTSHTNIIAVAEAALAAGVKIIALMPMSPKDAMASNPNAMRQFISSKNIMATYARNRDGCYLVDPSGVFLDPASASYQPIGASSGSINAVMADGLHPSVRGAEVSAKYITPLIQKIGARRYPKALSIADVWDATNNKAGNILGASGTMQVVSGGTLNGQTNMGVADGWSIGTSTVAVSGGPNVAPAVSIVDCDYVAPGYKAQRFDFTGLRSGQWGGVLSMNYTRWQPAVFSASPRMDAEMVIRINCPNIYSARLNIQITGGTSQGDSVDIGSTSLTAAGTIKVSNDYIFVTLKRPFKTYNFNQQCDFAIVINGLYDAPLSGTIDIAHCGLFALHTS